MNYLLHRTVITFKNFPPTARLSTHNIFRRTDIALKTHMLLTYFYSRWSTNNVIKSTLGTISSPVHLSSFTLSDCVPSKISSTIVPISLLLFQFLVFTKNPKIGLTYPPWYSVLHLITSKLTN